MKWTMDDFNGKRIAVAFDNVDQISEFLRICDDEGICWKDGSKAFDSELIGYLGVHLDREIGMNCHGSEGMLAIASRFCMNAEGIKSVQFSDYVEQHDRDWHDIHQILVEWNEKTKKARIAVNGLEIWSGCVGTSKEEEGDA